MATGMFGANTEVLRQIAGRFGTNADITRDAARTTLPEVESVEWFGDDADRFRDGYRSVVGTRLTALALVLEAHERAIVRHAIEQDLASGGEGASAKPGADDRRQPLPPRTPTTGGFWSQLWGKLNWLRGVHSQIRNPFRGVRFVMEAAYAIRNAKAFGPFFTTSWKGLTGWNGATFLPTGVEHLLANNTGFVGKIYTKIKAITDLLQAKGASARLEGWIAKGIDAVFGLKSGTAANHLTDVLGKSGRLLGKGLGALSVGLNGWSTIEHLRAGEYGAALWDGTKMALGIASFVPGPVGWAASGINVGMSLWENRESIGNAITGAFSWVGDRLQSLNPFD